MKNEEESGTEPVKPTHRLCSEIQLFDLCNLEQCAFKDGRFCKDKYLLARFELIADEDVRLPVLAAEDLDQMEDEQELSYDDASVDVDNEDDLD